MSVDLAALTEELLRVARRAGAEAADALAVAETALSVDVLGGALEQAERAEGVELGLRVLVGRRQACVAASDIRRESLEAMAERAVAMAREAPEDPWAGLAEPGQLARHWDLAALELADPADEPAPATLEEDARRAEAAALAVAGVAQVQSASAGYSRRRLHLGATNGFSGGYERTARAISCVAISGEGLRMERDYASESRVFQADLPDPESIGREAGERAASRAGPRRPRTGAWPVLFDERIAASLIGHLLAAVDGTAIARGSSWLREAMDEPVLPPALSVIEDPLRTRSAASRPFDAEGLPARTRRIVEQGVLREWTLDLKESEFQFTTAPPPGTDTPNPFGEPNRGRESLFGDPATSFNRNGFLEQREIVERRRGIEAARRRGTAGGAVPTTRTNRSPASAGEDGRGGPDEEN